mgnify:FL=1
MVIDDFPAYHNPKPVPVQFAGEKWRADQIYKFLRYSLIPFPVPVIRITAMFSTRFNWAVISALGGLASMALVKVEFFAHQFYL